MSTSIRALSALSLALAAGACSHGSPGPMQGQGGGGGATSSSSASSAVSASSASSSSGGVCTPAQTMTCYGGPAGTEGVGACKPGLATCLPDGSGFGACLGQILPQPDDCHTLEDEDCDGTSPPCAPPGTPRWITGIPLTVGTTAGIDVVGLASQPSGLTLVLLDLQADLDVGLGLVHATPAWCGGALLLVALDDKGKPVWQLPLPGGVKQPALDVTQEGTIWLAGINTCPGFQLTGNTGAFLAIVGPGGVVGATWASGSFQLDTLSLAASGTAAGLLTQGWGFDAGGVQSGTFGVQLSAFTAGAPPSFTKAVSPTPTYGEHALGRAGDGFAVYSAQNGLHRIDVVDAGLSSLWNRTLTGARVLALDTIDPVLVLGGELVGSEDFGLGNVVSDGADGFLAGYHAMTGAPIFVVPLGGPGDQAVVSVHGKAGTFAAALTADPTTLQGTSVQGGVVLRITAVGTVAWIDSVLAKPGKMMVAVAGDGAVVVAGTYRGGAVAGYPVPAQEGLAVMTLEP